MRQRSGRHSRNRQCSLITLLIICVVCVIVFEQLLFFRSDNNSLLIIIDNKNVEQNPPEFNQIMQDTDVSESVVDGSGDNNDDDNDHNNGGDDDDRHNDDQQDDPPDDMVKSSSDSKQQLIVKRPSSGIIPNTIDKTFRNFNPLQEYKSNEDKLTVVITTYKQPICLERMIIHMRSCPVVAEIRVNWFEDEEPQLHNGYTQDHKIPVIFDRYPDKLSYRFHPRNFTTDAVFSLDVDVFYSCESLAKAMYTWKQAGNNTAVGFHGRKLNFDGIYDFRISFQAPAFKYNTVFVTKGGIIHKEKFDEFFKDEYKALRDKVDESMTAEDILMSLILDQTHTQIIQTCPQIRSICHVGCRQNGVKPLVKRTSSTRKNVTNFFFDHFGRGGDVLPTLYTGHENTVWQKGRPEEECMSMNNSGDKNTDSCKKFCEYNLVCPSTVLKDSNG